MTGAPRSLAAEVDEHEPRAIRMPCARDGSLDDVVDPIRDALTGLPGPALLLDRIGQALVREPGPGANIAVIVVELDSFAELVGLGASLEARETVRAAANCLLKPLRPSDTLARLGGCRFAVLCERIERDAAARDIAESLALALLRPMPVAGHHRRVSASIGIAIAEHADYEPHVLLAEAERCLDEGRRREGAGTVVIAGRRTEQRRAERLSLEDALRRALHERQLRLLYQPIVSMPGGEVTAVEALLRWQHPTRGLVSPAEFLPIAEESGIIVAIGAWALRQACRDAARWSDDSGGQPRVNVNLSAAEVVAPDLPEMVDEILAETGLPADRVGLEVTENVLLQRSRPVVLRELRQRGLRVLLDDFGTGSWTRSALGHLPIDAVKFDRALVSRLGCSADVDEAVGAAAATAGALDIACIAVGVETAQQADQACERGCGHAQGYYFARPMTAAELCQHLGAPHAARFPGRSRARSRLADGLARRQR